MKKEDIQRMAHDIIDRCAGEDDRIEYKKSASDVYTNAAHRVSNWPPLMFAELATNCILHKEYSKRQYVGIYIYGDHISFINHNRPLPPVTIEDMNTKMEFQDRNYLNIELKEMFFNLDLIQSYGSGIRRAKKAMEDNASPKLVFEPDNDMDDYTMVTAYINEEFARVQREEATLKGASAQETAQEKYDELTEEEKIIILLSSNPQMTRKELAEKISISPDAVKRRLDKLKKSRQNRASGIYKGWKMGGFAVISNGHNK